MNSQPLPRTARRVIVLAGVLASGTALLSGCADPAATASASTSQTTSLTDGMTEPAVRASSINTGETVTLYRGQELHCLEGFKGQTNEGAVLSCDYVRFYAEHPDLPPTPSSSSTAP